MSGQTLSEYYDQSDSTSTWFAKTILRLMFAGAFAVVITIALLYLEQFLIDSGDSGIDESDNLQLVDIVRTIDEVEVVTRERRKKPPPPDEAPKTPKPQLSTSFDVSSAYSMSAPVGDVPNLELSGAFGFSDGEYLPIVKVAPEYPRRALVDGLAGWVLVEFTVTSMGTVIEPFVVDHCAVIQQNPGVLDCADRPDNIFDRSALKAAQKFKYKPKVIDGEPIETAGVRNKIMFVLAEL